MEIGSVQNSNYNNYNEVYQKNDNAKVKNSENNVSDTIQAGELNLGGQLDSRLKSLLGQKAALETQLYQFEQDSEIDDELKNRANRKDECLKEAESNTQEINRIKKMKEELKQTYGIEDDSIEEKDLKLLEKKAKWPEALTKEELDRLENMGPLTEYQKAALDYTKMESVFRERANDAIDGYRQELWAIDAIKLERLKSNPMIDAKKEAEAFLEKINREVMEAIAEEVKNKVNENLDIKPEEQLLTNPQALVDQKKLTKEDLKGLAVDEIV